MRFDPRSDVGGSARRSGRQSQLAVIVDESFGDRSADDRLTGVVPVDGAVMQEQDDIGTSIQRYRVSLWCRRALVKQHLPGLWSQLVTSGIEVDGEWPRCVDILVDDEHRTDDVGFRSFGMKSFRLALSMHAEAIGSDGPEGGAGPCFVDLAQLLEYLCAESPKRQHVGGAVGKVRDRSGLTLNRVLCRVPECEQAIVYIGRCGAKGEASGTQSGEDATGDNGEDVAVDGQSAWSTEITGMKPPVDCAASRPWTIGDLLDRPDLVKRVGGKKHNAVGNGFDVDVSLGSAPNPIGPND